MFEGEKELSIAVQKGGRLGPESVALLRAGNFEFRESSRVDRTRVTNYPLKIYFVRNGDIPEMVESGDSSFGITGEVNLMEARTQRVITLIPELGFGNCSLVVGVAKNGAISTLDQLRNKRITTSFPNLTDYFFSQRGIPYQQKVRDGSVELAITEGWADAIVDIRSSGESLVLNGIVPIDTVVPRSEAQLVASPLLRELPNTDRLVEPFLREILAVLRSRESLLFIMNVPNERMEEVREILPRKSPTISPEADQRWLSVQTLVPVRKAREIREKLLGLGVDSILEIEAKKVVPNKDDMAILEMMNKIYR